MTGIKEVYNKKITAGDQLDEIIREPHDRTCKIQRFFLTQDDVSQQRLVTEIASALNLNGLIDDAKDEAERYDLLTKLLLYPFNKKMPPKVVNDAIKKFRRGFNQ